MSATDERLAIWRYATPEERQRVIDGDWGHNPGNKSYIRVSGLACCPLGAAFPIEPYGARVANPMNTWVAEYLIYRIASFREAARLAQVFMNAWDEGEITRAALIAHLRRLNAQEARQ